MSPGCRPFWPGVAVRVDAADDEAAQIGVADLQLLGERRGQRLDREAEALLGRALAGRLRLLGGLAARLHGGRLLVAAAQPRDLFLARPLGDGDGDVAPLALADQLDRDARADRLLGDDDRRGSRRA